MNYNAPNHFGYHFELNINKIPTKESDRISLGLLLPGGIIGFLLIFLGVYEFLHGASPLADEAVSQTISFWFNLTFFDIVLVALGAWIICSLSVHYFTYKKVFFDGKKITIIYRRFFGKKKTVKEAVKKYKGVRFRVEFFQFGLINRNKYIIELYHDEPDKIAPLYISTSGHNIRKIWKDYALALKLPEIILTAQGWVVRDLENIGKSLVEMGKEGLITSGFNVKEKIPASISLVQKKDKSVIKSKSFRWDYLNILATVGICVTLLLLALHAHFVMLYTSALLASFLILCFIGLLILRVVTKDKIIAKQDKLVIIRKFPVLSSKKKVLKEEIEAIDVAFNPSSERYFLAIIGNDKTFVFGKKMPVNDLEWIRKYLIHNITKK